MSLFNNFDVSGSALSAQNVRLNLISSNLANANTVSSSIDQTYRSRQPVFSAMLEGVNGDENSNGVRVLGVVESDKPLRTEYSPEHPLANEEGYISLPNVNVIEEMANMISASRSYQTNVEVVKTSKNLISQLLKLGQS
ncbi:MAG: flagellar basal body rod protein FlgC [Methylococcales bacterium]|jgi:flagellar basal-body rod protein FlgC|nr:flagellar basal body rod protein FlgC [Methylococcales bacterium]MBT7444500.1 flagellar basal body rod protein FlgC [Methylococcales bacterium]